MSKQKDKTNVMRILDSLKLDYQTHNYTDTDAISGLEVASALGQNPDVVFKTLVTEGHSRNYYVFLVPVSCDLDLKKAAKSVGEKSVEMIKLKDLLPLTGYVHGGCSPIGMKKPFKTTIDETAELYDKIIFSGGKIGYQIEISLSELKKAIDLQLADIVSTSVA